MAFVPNVQEMVSSDPFQVPEKFLVIRNEEDKPESVADACRLSSKIPIIDLSLLSSEHKEKLNKLDQACQEWGFFQVVATEVLQEMKDAAAKFFQLPLEEKNKICTPADKFQGYGQAYVVSEGQRLDRSDALFLFLYPAQSRKLEIWPTAPKGFKEAIEAFSSEIKRAGEELLMSLPIMMGMEKDALLGLHEELLQDLRVNYIPPCSMPDKVLALSPHSDTGSMTILMQEDNVTALQIKKGREWVPVEPIPNALVVNLGDVIEIWSNGKYKSIEHRAVTTQGKSRISFASFLFPHGDLEVEPFDHMVESSRSRMYKKVKYGDYLKNAMKGKIDGKTHVQFAKIGS